MRMNRIRGLVTRMLLVVTLLFGVIALTGSTAQAQSWRRFDGHRDRAGRIFAYPRQFYWQDRKQ